MNTQDTARANRRQILRLLLREGGLSRSEMAQRTGLAPSTVSDLTDRLLDLGVLTESNVRRSGRRGRPHVILNLSPDNTLVIVAEYADAEARAALVEPGGTILATATGPLGDDSDFEACLSAMQRGVAEVGRGNWERVKAITIVGPGVVDPADGRLLLNSHNGWRDRQMLDPFRRFERPVFLENGSRLRALAENWYGATEDIDDFIYFHLDTGIGGAIVMDGMLVEGPSHGAGEFGHMLTGGEGPLCACGARGCVESIASMRAVTAVLKSRDCTDFAGAWALFRQRHGRARNVFGSAVRALTQAILNASVALGPTTVLLGGRMVEQTDGEIVRLINVRLKRAKSLIGRLDVRRAGLPEQRSHILGALTYALQEIDIAEA